MGVVAHDPCGIGLVARKDVERAVVATHDDVDTGGDLLAVREVEDPGLTLASGP